MELLHEYSSLVAPATRDPFTEHPDLLAVYQGQAAELFDAMLDRIKREAVEYFYKTGT